MTKLYLIRHGEVNNPEGVEYMRLPGFYLSERGIKQIQKVRDYFRDKNISKIYASPLERTRQSAKIISDGEITIEYSKELLEANYKLWEGLKYEERDQKLVKEYYKNPIKVTERLGEPIGEIQDRVVKKLIQIAKKHKGENVICVFHADPILSARLFFENKSLMLIKNIPVNHASITTITFDNKLECTQVEYKEIVKAEGWRK